MKVVPLILALALSGCAGKIALISEGKVYPGTYNTGTKQLDVTVEGSHYTGQYVMGQVNTFSSGAAYTYGKQPIFGSGSSIATSNQGQALLISSDNKTIRCQFMASGLSGQGECVDSSGRRYDFIASQN